MTVSIANMSQVWMSNTNVYSAISMSVSTMGYGANSSSSLLKLNRDGNSVFLVTANGATYTRGSTAAFVGGARTTNVDAFALYSGSGEFNVYDMVTQTNRLTIDTSGRVTKPYQPFFMGYPTTQYSGGSMPTQVMAVTSTFNNGNCFNGSTNRFTCPINGWYRVTWGGLQLPATVTSLQVNGSDVHNGNHYPSAVSYITMTQTALRYQSAGDYFTIRQWNGGGYYNDWWLWSVELVG